MTTATKTDIIGLAKQLADEFRPRAADYDRTAEFPVANYDRMRETGYLRAAVPEELGGMGADLQTLTRAQEELARGCASTALAVNMHEYQVGVFADAFRKGMPTEALLRRVATEGIVLASIAAEGLVAGEWSPPTTAEKRNGDYVLNGRGHFCSQAPGMTLVRANAHDTETNEFLVFSLASNLEGLQVVETWDTTGMRATASHDVVLKDVTVPEGSVAARFPAGEPMRLPPFINVARWFMPMVASVYLGLAEEAREEAMKAIGKGINSNSRTDALTDMLIGQMDAEILTARSVRDYTTTLHASDAVLAPELAQQTLAQAILCKDVATRACIAAVEKAVEIAGGRSFFRKSPLERLARDVRAARVHPPSAPISFQIAGQRAREAWQG